MRRDGLCTSGARGINNLNKFENTVEIFKQIHPDSVLLFQFGNFYRAYGRDSLILAYMFSYKLTEIQGIKNCGFPRAGLNKVMTTLEDNCINYIILNKCDKYNEEDKQNFKSKNKYMEIYEKAKAYLSEKNRVDRIYKTMLENIGKEQNKERLREVEKIIYG